MSTDIVEDIQIDEKIEKTTEVPKRYKVIFLNDNHTPVEWVIELLTVVFKHSHISAEQLTMTIHTEGSGIAGVYSFEIAETKTNEAVQASRQKGFPLQIKMEEED
ncbi:MAG: ATP-dependent Clp protease adaptor ClpS [Euryarchaeota archaeon]|jgi:ATP-dependent Clp protease adaptor protein ClpS